MKKKKQMDYQGLFVLGISLVGTSVVFITAVNVVIGIAFLAIGCTYMIIGGKNKREWKKK